MDSLHKFLDKSVLPKNYDGNLPEIDYTGKNWYPCIEGYIDHIKLMNTYGRVKK